MNCLAETDNTAAHFGGWTSATTHIHEKINTMPAATAKKDTVGYTQDYIFYLLIFVVIVVCINYYIHNHYSQEVADDLVGFPIQTCNALFVFLLIVQLEFTAYQSQRLQEESLATNLSLFTQQVVVDRWEEDAMKDPKLNDLYEKIMSNAAGGANNSFYTKEEWEALNIPVEYVPYKGNETEWHYAAKFIQEMVNIVRMFDLQEKFRLHSAADLEKSTKGKFAGWITCFRMFLAEPIIRNVWEQYKFRHVNPAFSAWIKFYCTDVLDNDPEFWSKHKAKWMDSVHEIYEQNAHK